MHAPPNASSIAQPVTVTTTTTVPAVFSPCSDCWVGLSCPTAEYGNRKFRMHFGKGDPVRIRIDTTYPLSRLVDKTSLVYLSTTVPYRAARATHSLVNRGARIVSVSTMTFALRCHPLDVKDTSQLSSWLNDMEVLRSFNNNSENCGGRLEALVLKVIEEFETRFQPDLTLGEHRGLVSEVGLLAACAQSNVIDRLFNAYQVVSQTNKLASAVVVVFRGHADVIASAPKDTLDANELWALAQELVPKLDTLLITGDGGGRASERSVALLSLVTAVFHRLSQLDVLIPEAQRELARWANIRMRKGQGHGDKVSHAIKRAVSDRRRRTNDEVLFEANLMQQALARCPSEATNLSGAVCKAGQLGEIGASLGLAVVKLLNTGAQAGTSKTPANALDAAKAITGSITKLAGLKKVCEKKKKAHPWYDQYLALVSRLRSCKADPAEFEKIWDDFEAFRTNPSQARKLLGRTVNDQWAPHNLWSLIFGMVEEYFHIVSNKEYSDAIRQKARRKLEEIAGWNPIKGNPKGSRRAKELLAELRQAEDPSDPASSSNLLSHAQSAKWGLLEKAREIQRDFRESVPLFVPTRVDSASDSTLQDRAFVDVVTDFLGGEQRVLALVGEAGSGKTTAAQAVVDLLCEQDSRYIPVFLKLSTLRSQSDEMLFLKSDLDNAIKESNGAPLLIILDGADEIAPDPKFYERHLLSLGRFSDSKVLITCRRDYYKKNGGELSFAPVGSGGSDVRRICCWVVRPFDGEAVGNYINWWVSSQRNVSGWTVDKYNAELVKLGDLEGHTRRPFGLQVILESLPYADRKGAAFLYKKYVEKRFQNEVARQSRALRYAEHCLRFSECLAVDMFAKGDNCQDIALIDGSGQLKAKHAELKDGLGILASGSCPLKEDTGARFLFRHSSIRDYFVASAILRAFIQGDEEIFSSIKRISDDDKAVVHFFQDLFTVKERDGAITAHKDRLSGWLQDSAHRHRMLHLLPENSDLVTPNILYAHTLALLHTGREDGAVKWFRRAASGGHLLAEVMVASLSGDSNFNFERAGRSMREMADERRCSEAEVRVGRYLHGRREFSKALPHLTWAGEQRNHSEALLYLGDMYWVGEGVEQDIEKARTCLRMAGDKGKLALNAVDDALSWRGAIKGYGTRYLRLMGVWS